MNNYYKFGYKFNSKDAALKCVEWIKSWFAKNGPSCNAIVGISGGKDSTIVADLCVRALGKDRVIGVLMPNISVEMRIKAEAAVAEMMSRKESVGLRKSADSFFNNFEKYDTATRALNDGYKVCKYLGINHYVINIYDAVSYLLNEVAIHSTPTEQARINIAPRIRMTTLYAVAQSNNGRVANTSNYSERVLGYGTRWGDTVGDFAPLAELTCSEVKEIGRQLNIPAEFVERTPDDGLCGKSDEENFGFTYAELDEYLRTGRHVTNAEGIEMIARMKANEFKLKPIASFDPSHFIAG